MVKLWRMRQVTLEGKNTVFKSLAVTKIIHLLLIIKLHNNTIDLLYNIQKYFICQGKKVNIKHSTFCNGHEKGGLKNVDLRNKMASIQCCWVKIFMIGK